MSSTYTFTIAEVSKETYDEISRLLADAGYTHAFHETRDHGRVIDMHGIAIAMKPDTEKPQQPKE